MQIVYDNSNSMVEILEKIENFNIYNNGKKQIINKTNSNFNVIKNNLMQIFCSAHLEPAFGVSLHELTLNEMQNDLWLELEFNQEQIKNGLNFNALLIKLEETGGVNLIRKYNNKYEGRCFYLALEKITDLTSVIN